MADIFKELGELALGSRLKKISDAMLKASVAFYQQNNVAFEARWFPIFYTLTTATEPLSILTVSERTGLVHPTVVQLANELEAAGLIQSEKSVADTRRRLMSLTPKAQELLPTLRELWAVFSETNLQLLQKQKHNLLFALEEAEALWANFSELLSENLKKRQANNIEIVDYRPKWKADFKRLNLEWIEKYFKVEQTDIDQLNHPEAIIYSGGCIILAQITEGSESEIVGTAALIPDHEDPEQLELIKMAVSPRMQGKQIGKKLALAAIQKARDMGAKRIFLESNTALQPAMELYKKVGFQKVQMRSSPWERANIQMVLEL